MLYFTSLLTTDEVMDRLLEDSRLQGVKTTCELPVIVVDGEWRFRPEDLEMWIARRFPEPSTRESSERG